MKAMAMLNSECRHTKHSKSKSKLGACRICKSELSMVYWPMPTVLQTLELRQFGMIGRVTQTTRTAVESVAVNADTV